MPLSLNEIKKRAVAFSKEWEHETNEDAEAKSFWDGFFHIFDIPRRRVAAFERNVKKLDDKQGYIDLLWKGKLLIEHKSKGKDLDKAFKQAKDYFPGLTDAELPQYILVCDFYNFRLYDLENNTQHDFTLNKLIDNIRLFDFISGHTQHRVREQDPINIKAAEKMGALHDKLKAVGYEGHELELYLVRLVFCLFADDTGIFEPGIFYDLLDQRTKEDGSDLAGWMAQLFDVLNKDPEKRFKNLDENLAAFPYVNGKLFEEPLPTASFDSEMRRILIDCCALNWSAISPAIFGSLFQSVMDEKARRNLGAHYTSEQNILKLIKPLFLDELYNEFNKVKGNSRQLDEFHIRLSKLRFLDPACGCGNFLIVAYRELRMLEMEVIRAKFKNQMATNIDEYVNINVDQFYGIEYEEFPAQIAQVAMWLMDHQMNQQVSEAFGNYFVRIPLRKSATIVHGNALRTDWQSLITEEGVSFDYIIGNPPFIGKKEQKAGQKEDMEAIFQSVNGAGILDYVTAWYIKAAKYMQVNNGTTTAFVSTNSISQGEQVAILWNELFSNYHIKIQFAHRTFKWSNEAKGNAGVSVVIIGFSIKDKLAKSIYEYDDGEATELKVKNINPYLVEGTDTLIQSRRKPINLVPEVNYGSFALDDGNYTISEEERNYIVSTYPVAEKFIKPFIGGRELLYNEKRYCLWLLNANPSEISKIPPIKNKIELVRKWRNESNRTTTKKLALTPTIFAEIRQPNSDYLAFPTLSSENRRYIPIAFLTPETIASNQVYIIPNATKYHFGVLTSIMHMAWIRYTCGRLESRYRYSASIVYNNYPWPENPTEKHKEAVEKAAQAVLDARAQFPDSSLADLYDPNTMPPALVKAHQQLDKAVDLCYRPQPFVNETKRIEYLFELYDKYTAGLFVEGKKGKKKK